MVTCGALPRCGVAVGNGFLSFSSTPDYRLQGCNRQWHPSVH